MVVVADTSPLNYLILIGEVSLLRALYRRIIVPDLVLEELRHADAPVEVVKWAATLPVWVTVTDSGVTEFNSDLAHLDGGEAAAIRLAQENLDSLLLIDETLGRAEAAKRQISTIGTLGILRDAATLSLVDLEAAFTRLRQTSFRAPASVMADLLALDTMRRKSDR